MFKKLYVSLCSIIFLPLTASYDATIVGGMQFAEGLGGIAAGIIDCVHDKLKINFIPTSPLNNSNQQNVPHYLKEIILGQATSPGKVAILTDVLWFNNSSAVKFVPMESKVKIAYSMVEYTHLTPVWVNTLNNKFDAVVVPDPWHLGIYQDSGVKIPIFVIPPVLHLDHFLNEPLKTASNSPFTFGSISAIGKRKNFSVLIDSFIREFGNNNNVRLVIHARAVPEQQELETLQRKILSAKVTNIAINTKRLNRHEYAELLKSFDCYVLLSKGEGFSITPREAMALGVPCILSNNTAHTTICNTGLVRAVKSDIRELVHGCEVLGGGYCGYHFNCKITEVCDALRDMYSNFSSYTRQRNKAREWVKKYLPQALKNKYLSLIKPKKVIFGPQNIVTDEYVMTNSTQLFYKYKSLH